MRSRRNNNVLNIKDYIVPIFIFLLIFILIYIAFSGGSDEKVEKTEISKNTETNQNSILVQFGSDLTEAEVIKSNNKKNTIKSGELLNPGESIIVKSGDISFKVPEIAEFSLDTNGKLEYLKNSKFKLESSSLWIKSENISDLNMRYAKVNIGKNSIINLEQTEVSSTVYLLKGKVEVINNGGQSTFLTPGTKIIISSKNASSKDLDMNLLKEDFDDYFKISPWFLKNNGGVYLNSNNSGTIDVTDSGSEDNIVETKNNLNISGLLNFDNIYDEGSVNSSNTNVSGKFADDRIEEIYISGKKAVINKQLKTFNVLGVDTSNKVNDIIIKIFDSEGSVLSKYVYTLYYSESKKVGEEGNKFEKINTKSYPVNGSDFVIDVKSVSTGKSLINGETYDSKNTFYGTVKNPDVKSVTVNGYKLKTFNGRTFRFHAYEKFKTLGEGVNNYEIKYFDINGKVILKKYITINKKSKKIKTNKNISGEVKIN